jgi:glycosyltransferase involved in cell wall biosynthesis
VTGPGDETGAGAGPARTGSTGRHGWRPGSIPVEHVAAPGVRIVVDIRPLQDPGRAPLTAAYLDGLLGALNDDPRDGESFAFMLSADGDDPTRRWPNLEVIGRRRLPPTRFLRSGALTVDPLMLRGATVGAGWRAERGGASGAVYHAAGGSMPIASRIPVVAALLDLAPWAMPDEYQRGTSARFGQRLRARLLHDAAAVLVPGRATATDARRLLHVKQARIHVVPLAARLAYRPDAAVDAPAERDRLGLGARYAVYAGRYDARQDLSTLLDALGRLAVEPAPAGVAVADWPPRVCLVGASPDDRASLSRSAGRAGVAEAIVYAQGLPEDRLAALVAGARMLILPVRSEASGLAALDALAAGVPVVASAVGVLPEVVGAAGILVDPGDPARLATAIRAAWSDDDLHRQLATAARERPAADRSWADVARETRAIWAEVASRAPLI